MYTCRGVVHVHPSLFSAWPQQRDELIVDVQSRENSGWTKQEIWEFKEGDRKRRREFELRKRVRRKERERSRSDCFVCFVFEFDAFQCH